MREAIGKLLLIVSVLFGIPFGVFLTAYLDINNWLVLSMPFLLSVASYLVLNRILKKDQTWVNCFAVSLLAVVVALCLNRYIKVGEPETEDCVIINSEFVHNTSSTRVGTRIDEKYYTYEFEDGKFRHAWLLRKYNGAMGDMGNHGVMRMTFRRGLLGIRVLTATQWIDDDGSVYYERTDQ
jgi:hypothetical protein